MECGFTQNTTNPAGEAGAGCQFPNETEFFDIDGKHYCRFHLPMVGDSGEPTAKASWRLDDHKRFFKRLNIHARNAIGDGHKALLSGIIFPIGFSPAIVFGARNSIPRTSFEGCTFVKEAKFGSAVFEDVAVFVDTVFEEAANFRSAEFKSQANFEGAKFRKKANFELADFIYIAKFENSDFRHAASFESASFGDWTFFTHAEFHGVCSFDYAAFNNGVFFDSSNFYGRTSFQVRTEQNRHWNARRGFATNDEANNRQDKNFPFIDFNGAVFRGRTDFSNRHFLEATDFSNVEFAIAPEFHNCKLHQDTDFSGTQFKDTKSNHAARAYRTLKLAMGDVRARNEEAMFYAREQDSLRRRKDTPWSIKVMSWAYMALSDYGRSYVRPLTVLTVMTACFAFVYWFWAISLGGSSDLAGVFAFAMKQIVRPFYIWTSSGIAQSEPTAVVAHYPLALRLSTTIQSVASFALVTLVLLALRRQFRLH
jgi:hypothetical protein